MVPRAPATQHTKTNDIGCLRHACDAAKPAMLNLTMLVVTRGVKSFCNARIDAESGLEIRMSCSKNISMISDGRAAQKCARNKHYLLHARL